MTYPQTRHYKKSTLCLFALVLAILIAGCAAPKTEEQDKHWTRAEDLIDTSDRIFTARFVESQIANIPQIDSNTGASAGVTEILFRQFEIVNSLKGTSEEQDLLWVAFEPSRSGELVDGQGQVQEFRDSPTYVLFLKGRLRPLEYPPEFGAVLWTGNGEPSFAELSGQDLLFMADRVFMNLLKQEDTRLPSTLSAAPFELTLADLETITR
jgi:hypothetical protein